jgi:hypothetical protein
MVFLHLILQIEFVVFIVHGIQKINIYLVEVLGLQLKRIFLQQIQQLEENLLRLHITRKMLDRGLFQVELEIKMETLQSLQISTKFINTELISQQTLIGLQDKH